MGSISKKISISGNFDASSPGVAILKSSPGVADVDETAELAATAGLAVLDVTNGAVAPAGVTKLEVLAADEEATAAVATPTGVAKLEESPLFLGADVSAVLAGLAELSVHPGGLRGSCDR